MSTHQILLILFTVLSVLSIKKSEIGSHDWNIRTIGKIDDISFTKRDRIIALSKDAQLSHINKTSGELLTRTSLGDPSSIIKEGNRGKLHSILSAQESGSYLRTSINNDDQKVIAKLDHPIIQTFCANSVCNIVSSHSVGTLTSSKQLDQNEVIKLQNGKYVYAYKHSDQNIIAVHFNDNKICAQLIQFTPKIRKISEECINTQGKNVQFFEDYLILSDGQTSTIRKLSTLKQIKKVEGKVYKFLPISSSIILVKNDILTKLQLNTLQTSKVQKADIIEENTKGKLFSVSYSSGNSFILQIQDQRRVQWKSKQNKISQIWLHEISEFDYQMLVQYDDLRVEYFNFGITTRSQSQITFKWFRQQSLAYIQNAIFLDYQNQIELSNKYYQSLLHNYQQRSIITLFIQRLTFQIKDFVLGVQQLIQDTITTLSQINFANLFKGKQFIKLPQSDRYEKYFGMRKIIIASTTNNLIFGIDSKTSNILWKTQISGIQSNPKMFRMVANETQKVILTYYDTSKKTLFIQELNWQSGEYKTVNTFKVLSEPFVFQVGEHKLGIKNKDTIQYYKTQNQQTTHSFLFYNIEGSNVYCQDVQSDGKLQSLWNMTLPQDEEVIRSLTSFRNDKQSKLPLFKENIVYLKNIDYTNFAILTKTKNTNNLNLYVINGENGHILLHKYKRNVDFQRQINLVYDENSVLVSYFNTLNKMYEIWVIEQYKDKVYTSVTQIITKYFKKDDSQQDSTHHKIKNNLMVFESVFGSPLAIKNMYVSTSKMSLIKRNVFIVSRDDQIYSLDRRLLTTRRPSSDSPIQNEKYPAYDYLIPINPISFLSYNINLKNIRKVQFSPTSLESTFLLLAYGDDIFMTRCSPDGTFDMITDDFNYPFLAMVVIVVTVLLRFVKGKVKKAAIAKQYKN